ncbi:UDP-glucose 4-epimerase [Kineococcus radiotolerans]|uniref:UDP-3-O-(3-hydroxymyristoyl)-like protein n=1 Tax=Kineococcus radiotolerans (strain ATCC BAA-149 / DSM 14245 / SRS30216) TaxID=266940 RepID=A6WGZ6_KINRD|nr:UDP-glucose 4-epimerase [Kineococcus radiotolerans]ABS06085.1 UDP-3-O-(3-hydroxymyristoyl)-like protein [Kineococcus radiotolerans SRS30216 = ATCC BAA-149]
MADPESAVDKSAKKSPPIADRDPDRAGKASNVSPTNTAGGLPPRLIWLIVGIIVVAVAVIVGIWVYLPDLFVPDNVQPTPADPNARVTAEISARSPLGVLSGAVMAAAAAGIGVVVSHHTASLTRAALEETRRANDLTDQRDVTGARDDRFGKAVEQLGHTAAAVRLGGMHSLFRLADEDRGRVPTVVDILCAYLRQPFHHPDHDAPADSDETTGDGDATADVAETGPHQPRPRAWQPSDEVVRDLRDAEAEVRRTAQRLITAMLPLIDGNTPPIEVNLRGAQLLDDFTLTGQRLGKIDLTNFYLSGDLALVEGAHIGVFRLGSRAHIGGDLTLGPGAHIDDVFWLGPGAHIGGKLWLGSDAHIGGDLTLGQGAHIDDDLQLGPGVHIGGKFWLGAHIGGDLQLGPGAHIGGEFRLGSDAHIGGDLTLGPGAHIDGVFWLGLGAHIGGDLTLGPGAHIGGDLWLGPHAHIDGVLWLREGAHIGSHLTLGEGAYIGGHLQLEQDAHIDGHLQLAQDAHSDRDLELGQDAYIEGNLRLGLGARIEGRTAAEADDVIQVAPGASIAGRAQPPWAGAVNTENMAQQGATASEDSAAASEDSTEVTE